MTRDPLEQCYASLIRNLNPSKKNISYQKYLLSIAGQYTFYYKKLYYKAIDSGSAKIISISIC